MNLADAGARVTMAVRGDALGERMSAYLVERIERQPRIDVRVHTEVASLDDLGDQLASVTLVDAGAGTENVPACAMFLCIGGH